MYPTDTAGRRAAHFAPARFAASNIDDAVAEITSAKPWQDVEKPFFNILLL